MGAEYTSKQKFYLCCGWFCAMLGCIGIYFWLVMFFFQATHAPYLIYEMQGLRSMDDTTAIDTYKWSFLITSVVSTSLPNRLTFHLSS